MNKPTIIVLAVSAALVTLGGVFVFNPVTPNFNKSWFDQEEEIVGQQTDDVVNLTLIYYMNFPFNVKFRYPQEWQVRETENNVTFFIEPTDDENTLGDFHVEFRRDPGRDFEAEFSGEEFFSKKERENDTLYHFRQRAEESGVWVSFYFFQKGDRVVAVQHVTEHPYVSFFNVMVNSMEFDFWQDEEIQVAHPEEGWEQAAEGEEGAEELQVNTAEPGAEN